jgi:hypothetical protein
MGLVILSLYVMGILFIIAMYFTGMLFALHLIKQNVINDAISNIIQIIFVLFYGAGGLYAFINLTDLKHFIQ